MNDRYKPEGVVFFGTIPSIFLPGLLLLVNMKHLLFIGERPVQPFVRRELQCCARNCPRERWAGRTTSQRAGPRVCPLSKTAVLCTELSKRALGRAHNITVVTRTAERLCCCGSEHKATNARVDLQGRRDTLPAEDILLAFSITTANTSQVRALCLPIL